MVSLSKVEIIRLRNYLLVGGSAFVVEYGVFAVLDTVLSVNLLVAQSVSFILGLTISFLGSRFITFAGKQGDHSHSTFVQVASFLGLGLFNLVASNAVIYALVVHLDVAGLVAKILVMACIVVWNYLIFNKLIFK